MMHGPINIKFSYIGCHKQSNKISCNTELILKPTSKIRYGIAMLGGGIGLSQFPSPQQPTRGERIGHAPMSLKVQAISV